MSLQIAFTAGAETVNSAVMPLGYAPGANRITVRAERWAVGTGVTRCALGIPLRQGQLMPANIAQVSLWIQGVEIGVYFDMLGRYVDGSVRMLYTQADVLLTNGITKLGELRLTGGFTVARIAFVDQSATWNNTPGVTDTSWNTQGLPAGVIVPTSARHMAGAMPMGPMVPLNENPVFDGSTLANAKLEGIGITRVLANTAFPSFPQAEYNGTSALWNQWAITGNTYYLKIALSYYTKMRTEWWVKNGGGDADWWGVMEPRQSGDDLALGYMLLRDTVNLARTSAKHVDAGFNWFTTNDDYLATGSWADDLGPRFRCLVLQNILHLIQSLGPDGVIAGSTMAVWAERWINRTMVTNNLYDGEYFTQFPRTGASLPVWQNMMVARNIINICNCLPASAFKTTALDFVSGLILRIRQNTTTVNAAGRTVFKYYCDPDTFVGGDDEGETYNADLIGFFAPMMAWRAWYANSLADANAARDYYKTAGLPAGVDPGQGGPSIPGFKHFAENFHALALTMGYLTLADI